jgi:LysM repeat protein
MARRSPARYLAPLALVATVVALFLIVSPSSDDEPETSPNRTSESSQGGDGEGGDGKGGESGDSERKGPRRYTVRPGDTPSAIAERTGVPLERILELNPDLDPQTLSPGQRLKLRESGQ